MTILLIVLAAVGYLGCCVLTYRTQRRWTRATDARYWTRGRRAFVLVISLLGPLGLGCVIFANFMESGWLDKPARW